MPSKLKVEKFECGYNEADIMNRGYIMIQNENTTREQLVEKIVNFIVTSRQKDLEAFLRMGRDVTNLGFASQETSESSKVDGGAYMPIVQTEGGRAT